MEKIKDEGLAKSIGVSNFRRSDLTKLLLSAKEKPVINQIELHPYIAKEAQPLLDYRTFPLSCKPDAAQAVTLSAVEKHGIRVAAYGPTVPLTKASGGPLDSVLEEIAKSKGVEASQVLLKLASQMGALVVTTSGKDWRMKQCVSPALTCSVPPNNVLQTTRSRKRFRPF
jgi:diketogulonate reductase-like aldo/keto reductase